MAHVQDDTVRPDALCRDFGCPSVVLSERFVETMTDRNPQDVSMSDDELCLRIWGMTDDAALEVAPNMEAVQQIMGRALRRSVRIVDDAITATDVPSPHGSDAWPRDEVHNAARKVLSDARGLTPAARRAVVAEIEKVSRPLTGRAAQDEALGNVGRRVF